MDAEAEHVLGRRVGMCPWRAFADPFVAACFAAYPWAKRGEMVARYGGDPPEALLRGVQILDSALSRVEAHDIRKERDERERERAQQDAAPRPIPGAGRRRR